MGVLDLVFPRKCLECGERGKYICDSCIREVAPAKQKCPMCGSYAFGGRTHKSCVRKWGLSGARAVWRYEGVVRKVLIKLKYNFVTDVCEELVDRMVFEVEKFSFEKAFVLVPVPLSGSRKRWRGFNQTELVGRMVAERMGWGFVKDLVVRKKGGVPQAGLPRKERLKNVKDVFVLNSELISCNNSAFFTVDYPYSGSASSTAFQAASPERLAITKNASLAVADRKYIVFDDVWTTGATLRECGKVLKRAGADGVWGLTIAN